MDSSRASLKLPADEWNGRLAVVGVDGTPGRSLDAERGALLARGFACTHVERDASVTHAAIASAREALMARYGRAPQLVVAFALARSAEVMIRLAHEWPADCDGMVCAATEFGSPHDPDLLAFGRRGGRLMLVHGEDDEVTPARRVITFFEHYETLAGGPVPAAVFVRLFIRPGMDHSLRGPGSGRVDHCEHLLRWLEWTPRRPPDQPLLQRAKRADDDAPLFAPAALAEADVEYTRPAYPYPLRATAKGYGDVNDWRNWHALALYRRPPGPARPDELPKLVPQDASRRTPLVPDPRVGPVVVFGAAGRLGLEVVRVLRSQGVAVRAAVRDEAKARESLPDGVEVVLADVRDAQAVRRAVRGARTAIFTATAYAGGAGSNTPETVEYEGVLNLVAAARSEGLAHVVLVSSMCATQAEHVHNIWNDILAWKHRSEVALRGSGVPYTVIRPGGLWPAPGMPSFPGGTRGIRFAQGDRIAFGELIHREDCALVVAAAAGNRDAMGKTFEAWDDDSLPPGAWVGTFAAIARD